MQVLFLKSGVPFGYGYSAGEAGSINPKDAEILMNAGVIGSDTPANKKETAESPQAAKRTKRNK